jgi:transcriptional regulator with XRE-family HTH domain
MEDWGIKYLKQIGENIRHRREELQLSLLDVAYEADVAKSTILRIEQGKFNVSIIMLTNIANALDIDICLLLKQD